MIEYVNFMFAVMVTTFVVALLGATIIGLICAWRMLLHKGDDE